MNKSVYGVGQINHYLKDLFAQDFMLRRISVRGEVSNVKYHSSGHLYFTLKDEGGALAAVMFAGSRKGLAFPMKDGDLVVATGSIEVYERDGKYQLYARQIERDGEGALFERFEQLKEELEEMGMFAPEYKKEIPRYAKRIGVVTASTGAAIQDIKNISERRNPYVQMILCPAKVQGEGAAESIVKGIRRLDGMGLDILIVGRGGGSIEDLWAFNEEPVVRAIFECETPVISAVGHETDTTLSDYAADLRAPTPSAAAEIAVFDLHGALQSLEESRLSMQRLFSRRLQSDQQRIRLLAMRLQKAGPKQRLLTQQQRLQESRTKLTYCAKEVMGRYRQQLMILAEKMDSASPLKKMGQGYGFISDQTGKAKRSVTELAVGEKVNLYFTDGKAETEVLRIKPGTAAEI
ncbi:MAG: exodeoxyribonuclease VII large subunit [Lachnospiraceae bacterium]|nr:exodeoxyribonuclease VII large subunit [Lachnospiraceae bacterium]